MKRVFEDTNIDVPELQTVPIEARDVVAQIAEAWIKRGDSQSSFTRFMAEAGFKVPKQTLSDWLARRRDTGVALPGGDGRGRPRALEEEEVRLLVGYVLWRNHNSLRVSLSDVKGYLEDNLSVHCDESTVQRYLADQGFTSQKMKRANNGYKLSRSKMVAVAFEWLRKHWRMLKVGEVWCIDCTFLGHHLDTYYSYNVKGAPQPLLKEKATRFTNLCIGAISSLGRCFSPIVLTFNPKARRDRRHTARWDADFRRMDQLLRDYNVDLDCFIYIGNERDEKRTYVPAVADVTRRFLEIYQLDPGTLWLSDGGKEFFTTNGSVLEEFGLKHIAFESVVHQYQSSCDNMWFGAAKTKWRSRKLDYSDDILASITFLADLEETRHGAIEWFNRNLQLDKPEPTREAVAQLIGEKKVLETEYYKECFVEYCIAEGQDARGFLQRDPSDGLDGSYWQNE